MKFDKLIGKKEKMKTSTTCKSIATWISLRSSTWENYVKIPPAALNCNYKQKIRERVRYIQRV